MKQKILEDIVNSKLSDIIFQPTKNIISPSNMYVINFVKTKKLYSLHIFCFLRILFNNQILLTSCDEIVNCEYKLVSFNTDNSLVEHNISNVKNLTLNSVVTSAELLDCGDLIVTLSNQIVIEIRPDCLLNSFEYYRLFEHNNNKNKIIVSFINNNLCIE